MRIESFEETYAEYKKLFAKIDQADTIRGKNELFRQLTLLLSKMENGIDSDSLPKAKSHTPSFNTRSCCN